jgi:hypothetical protein
MTLQNNTRAFFHQRRLYSSCVALQNNTRAFFTKDVSTINAPSNCYWGPAPHWLTNSSQCLSHTNLNGTMALSSPILNCARCVGSVVTKKQLNQSSILGRVQSTASCTHSEQCAKKMLKHFTLRSTSGGSQRASSTGPALQGQGLAPPQAGRPRARSMLGSESARSSSRSGPTSHRPSSTSQIQPRATVPPSRPVSPTESSDLDEPISTGVRRRRDSSSDALQLTPRHTKRLKLHAQQLAKDRSIPLGKLLAFLEVQYSILLHYKVTSLI